MAKTRAFAKRLAADGGAKIVNVERFDEQRICEPQLVLSIRRIRAAGDDEDPYLGIGGSNARANVDAVFDSETQIEQNDVHIVRSKVFVRVSGGRCFQHAVAVELEIDPAEQPRGLVVFDEKCSRAIFHDLEAIPAFT